MGSVQALDGKHVLEVPLDEVAEVQGAKEDAIMEFHVDDAALRSREDALTSVTFVLPEGNADFASASRSAHVDLCTCRSYLRTGSFVPLRRHDA